MYRRRSTGMRIGAVHPGLNLTPQNTIPPVQFVKILPLRPRPPLHRVRMGWRHCAPRAEASRWRQCLRRRYGLPLSGSRSFAHMHRWHAWQARNSQTRVGSPPALMPLKSGLDLPGLLPVLNYLGRHTQEPGRKQVLGCKLHGLLVRAICVHEAAVFSQTIRSRREERRQLLTRRHRLEVVAAFERWNAHLTGLVPVMILAEEIHAPGISSTAQTGLKRRWGADR